MNKERFNYLCEKELQIKAKLKTLNQEVDRLVKANDLDALENVNRSVNILLLKLDFIDKRMSGFNSLTVQVNEATINPKELIQ